MLAFIRGDSLLVLRLGKDLKPQGEPRQIPLGQGARTANWMPDGRTVIIMTEGRFLKVPVSGSAQREQPAYAGGEVAMMGFALSKNGDRLAYSTSTTDFNIYRLKLLRPGVPAGPVVPFLSSTRADFDPQYSPDGEKIAFVSDRSGSTSVWVANADGSGAAPLVEGFLATWSPDGRRIAFARREGGKVGLYVINSNGGQPNWIAPVDDEHFPHLWFTWSQDGKWIYFPASRDGKKQAWKVPAGGGEPVPVPGLENAPQAQESPDGKFLFFQREQALWKMALPGGSATQILNRPTDNFTLTREGAYFLSVNNGIEYFDFATGGVKTVLTTEKMILGAPSVQGDGRFLLYTQMDSVGADLVLVENFH
jgi:Tol biopolymer transport system component